MSQTVLNRAGGRLRRTSSRMVLEAKILCSTCVEVRYLKRRIEAGEVSDPSPPMYSLKSRTRSNPLPSHFLPRALHGLHDVFHGQIGQSGHRALALNTFHECSGPSHSLLKRKPANVGGEFRKGFTHEFMVAPPLTTGPWLRKCSICNPATLSGTRGHGGHYRGHYGPGRGPRTGHGREKRLDLMGLLVGWVGGRAANCTRL